MRSAGSRIFPPVESKSVGKAMLKQIQDATNYATVGRGYLICRMRRLNLRSLRIWFQKFVYLSIFLKIFLEFPAALMALIVL